MNHPCIERVSPAITLLLAVGLATACDLPTKSFSETIRDAPEADGAAAGTGPAGSHGDDNSGLSCGPHTDITCGPGQVCLLAPGANCEEDGSGVCVAMPQTCPDEDTPVCGCDGVIYANYCEALAAGISWPFDTSLCAAPESSDGSSESAGETGASSASESDSGSDESGESG